MKKVFTTGQVAKICKVAPRTVSKWFDSGRLRGYLIQRAKVAHELGDAPGGRDALARAVELDPHDPTTRRELADMLFEQQEWKRARELIEGLLEDHEDLLQPEISVELHKQAAAGHGANWAPYVGVIMLAIALTFVWRSFYAMRIPKVPEATIKSVVPNDPVTRPQPTESQEPVAGH